MRKEVKTISGKVLWASDSADLNTMLTSLVNSERSCEQIELTGQVINGVDFSDTDLRGGYFKRTKFLNVSFMNARLHRARFDECVFLKCTFDDAALRGASLYKAVVEACTFYGADLTNVNVRKAFFLKTWVLRTGIIGKESAVFVGRPAKRSKAEEVSDVG